MDDRARTIYASPIDDRFESGASKDGTRVCLDLEPDYDQLFDALDRVGRIYATCSFLRIRTDSIFSVPTGVLKFQALETLVLEGSRFWDITPAQIPACVRTVVLLTNNQDIFDGLSLPFELIDFRHPDYLNDLSDDDDDVADNDDNDDNDLFPITMPDGRVINTHEELINDLNGRRSGEIVHRRC